MKILTDLHTHTSASAHAFSTITENIAHAAKNGIELIATTNHGPSSHCKIHSDHFKYLPYFIPQVVDGVTVLSGAEANILDETGKLDLDEKILKELDIVIASCHTPPFKPQSDESFKKTYTAIANNPQVDIVGHLCRNNHLNYLDNIIDLSMKKGKLIEINSLSFKSKGHGHTEKSKFLIERCLKHNAKIVVNSDAHYHNDIGNFSEITEYLKQVGYPEDLIINRNKKALLEFLNIKENL